MCVGSPNNLHIPIDSITQVIAYFSKHAKMSMYKRISICFGFTLYPRVITSGKWKSTLTEIMFPLKPPCMWLVILMCDYRKVAIKCHQTWPQKDLAHLSRFSHLRLRLRRLLGRRRMALRKGQTWRLAHPGESSGPLGPGEHPLVNSHSYGKWPI